MMQLDCADSGRRVPTSRSSLYSMTERRGERCGQQSLTRNPKGSAACDDALLNPMYRREGIYCTCERGR